jgi:ankyrin repeat protein
MRKLFSILILFFAFGCAHKRVSKEQDPVPPHPCFKATAASDLEFLKTNIETCKTLKTIYGTTPLMLAASRGKDDVINLLLSSGANINEVDNEGAPALNYSVTANKVSSAGLLILSGIDMDSRRPDGITALMLAIQQSSPEMVHTLTTTRQAINGKAEDGWTALYFAVRRQDPSILSLLLRQGACKNTTDSYKQTPLDFAKEVGWQQGIYLIEKAPACGTKKN